MHNFSSACAIEFEDKVVLTGGGHYVSDWNSVEFFVTNRVSVYNIGGWVEDLPDLITAGRGHGCGHYVDNSNNMVSIFEKRYLNNNTYASIYTCIGVPGCWWSRSNRWRLF